MDVRVEKRVRKSQDRISRIKWSQGKKLGSFNEKFLRKGVGSENMLDKWMKGLGKKKNLEH